MKLFRLKSKPTTLAFTITNPTNPRIEDVLPFMPFPRTQITISNLKEALHAN